MIDREQLYAAYQQKIRAYVGNRVHHVQDAEDVVSAVFLKLCAGLDTYDPSKAALSTWVYRITHNAVCDYYRAHARQKDTADLDDYTFLESPIVDEGPDEDELEALAAALETLSPRERDVVILRFYKGYSPAKVAETLGVSYENAKYIQHTAIKKLRRTIGKTLML